DDAVIIDKGKIRFDGSMRDLSENFTANVKLVVSTKDSTQSESGLLAFKGAVDRIQGVSILNDGLNQITYLVPKASLRSVFNLFPEGLYDLEVSPLDFENNVVNLFKTWSGESS
ncbi:MAG: hypothetical protein JHC54_16100, partial [Acinetobacter sp.]|nr:hypothetical protein [Acinetobacter sp.]